MDKPLLFTGEMVRAILRGRKTITSRPLKPQPRWVAHPNVPFKTTDADPNGIISSPVGNRGDIIWVRETWYCDHHPYCLKGTPIPKEEPEDFPWEDFYYRADGECCQQIPECCCAEVGKVQWRPSIHIPRWASRLSLLNKNVKIQRIQRISEEDAMAEGVRVYEFGPTGDQPAMYGYITDADGKHGAPHHTAKEAFRAMWDSLYPGELSWDNNPFVATAEFEIHQLPDRRRG